MRTANKGEIGCQRIQFVQFNPNDSTKTETAGTARVYIGNDWTYVEFYVTLTGALSHILVNGGGAQWYIQDYCMGQFTLSKVEEIPAGAKKEFGTPNTDEEAREYTYFPLQTRKLRSITSRHISKPRSNINFIVY